MNPVGIMSVETAKLWGEGIADRIEETSAAVIRELRREGQCMLIWCGKILNFELEITGCDVYIDGEWVDSITHYSLIREFLEDIAEVAV